jgi:hypothetical protein
MLTSLGATRLDNVSRFSAPGKAEPGFAADTTTVSPEGASFTTPRIHPPDAIAPSSDQTDVQDAL